MADEYSPKPTTVPPFSCRLPQEFLQDLDERGRFLYTQADKVDQKMEWLMNHAIAQSEKLEEVRAQTTKTNGGLAQAKADIIGLKTALELAQPAIKTVNWGIWAAKKKVTWAIAAVFVFVVLPVMVSKAPEAQSFVFGLVKSAAGF